VVEVTIPSLQYAGAAQPVIMLSEAFTYHARNLRSKPEAFGDMVRLRFRVGGLFTAGEYVQAQRVRGVLKRECAATLQEVDLIASPTMSNPPPAFSGIDVMTTARVPSFTGPYNLTGMPAISIPCGFTKAGLPIGLQLAGKPFDEPTVLRAAYTYQQHVRLFEKRPPL
jgi:aspartyl-tRNA(Asn)/glutamyl-tRNA(Gln) amidotransferase subunit A